VGLPSNRGGNLYLAASCGGGSGYACNSGGSNGSWSLVRLWWANLLLSNTATPAASAITGPLLESGARGIQDLALTASDAGGPGVYSIKVQLDGVTAYNGTPDTNGGKCAPVGVNGGALMFDHSQPCRQSESVDLPIDTSPVRDGKHTLKVTIEDAAQNSAVVYDGAIVTLNAPSVDAPPTITTPSRVLVGTALSSHPGTWAAPSGTGATGYGYQWESCDGLGNNCQPIAGATSTGYTPSLADAEHTLRLLVRAANNDGSAYALSGPTTSVLRQDSFGALPSPGAGNDGTHRATAGLGNPNGIGASESAQLRLGARRAISRTYARRAVRLSGRLITPEGKPIGGASLDVLQQVAGASSISVVGHTRTGVDGTFIASVPPGPSRMIEVAYRAFSADAGYAARTRIEESVGAGVRLKVLPHRTNPEGTILLSGLVRGPIPLTGPRSWVHLL
jgi:hypothetical protein